MMKMNEKLFSQKSKIRKWIEQQEMKVETFLFYIQALNDSAECLKSMIKQKIIIMTSSFNLFKVLWSEIAHTAVYLYNRTSCYFLNWKSFYELFHTCLTHWDDVVVDEWKSQQAHLKVYDSKTYYMITEVLIKIKCLD